MSHLLLCQTHLKKSTCTHNGEHSRTFTCAAEAHPHRRTGDPLSGTEIPHEEKDTDAYWQAFQNLQLGNRPESAHYASLLRLSGDAHSLPYAHLAHFHIVQSGRSQNRYLGSLTVQSYLRCDALEDACAWFAHMHDRNVYTWTFMITEYAQRGFGPDAFLLFYQMLHEGVLPDEHIFTSVISACGGELDSIHGAQHHARIVGCGFDTVLVIGNALVNMYGKCGAVHNARCTFDCMPRRNVISWTAIIAAYAHHGQSECAFAMFEQMPLESVFPNRVTILSIMEACSSFEQAMYIHKFVLHSGLDEDIVVATALVSMYGKCSCPDYALSTFRSMRERSVISWNATIAVCTEHKLIKEALCLFNHLNAAGLVANNVSYINVVNALASYGELGESKKMHNIIVQEGYETAVDVATALIHMYGRCNGLPDARCVFDRIKDPTSISWNYMIRAYSCDGENGPALQLFDQMKQEGGLPDKFVFSSIISACSSKVAAREGMWMHVSVKGTGSESDVVVSTALLSMYCKCGNLPAARNMFDSMTTRDLICWNAMLDGYAQYGHLLDVLDFLEFMRTQGVVPDSASFVSLISACASLLELIEGQGFHAGAVLRGFEMDTAVATAIFNMYAKCGNIQEARQMFDKVPERNEVSWSAIIAAYAQHGHGKEALVLFQKMLDGGFQPNEVTFVSVFTACRHAGLLEEGRQWWFSMQRDYGIQPIADHYDCMIDLFSRVGRLDEAEDLLKKMPLEPTAISWMTLLSACRSKVDVDRGELAAKRILDLDTKDPSPYPILSSLYLAAERQKNKNKTL